MIELIDSNVINSFEKTILEPTSGDGVNMANLVEGDEIEIHPIDSSISPLVIHYAETFIVPASVKSYYLKKRTPGKAMVIQAFVRSI